MTQRKEPAWATATAGLSRVDRGRNQAARAARQRRHGAVQAKGAWLALLVGGAEFARVGATVGLLRPPPPPPIPPPSSLDEVASQFSQACPSEPQVLWRHRHTAWREEAGRLNMARYAHLPGAQVMSPEGPSVNATRQGDAGDCYFLAPLAALAHQRPESTTSMFRVLDGDTVAVGLHQPVASNSTEMQQTWIPVTTRVPVDRTGAPVYAQAVAPRSGEGPELWPALAEKAFAKLNTATKTYGRSLGYEGIGYGGQPAAALATLTGKEAVVVATFGRTPEVLFEVLSQSNHGAVMVASTTHDEPFYHPSRPLCVMPRHVYTVLGTRVEQGERLVQLRNPHGLCRQWPGHQRRDPPGPLPGNGHGHFELTIGEFREQFRNIALVERGETPPPAGGIDACLVVGDVSRVVVAMLISKLNEVWLGITGRGGFNKFQRFMGSGVPGGRQP